MQVFNARTIQLAITLGMIVDFLDVIAVAVAIVDFIGVQIAGHLCECASHGRH